MWTRWVTESSDFEARSGKASEKLKTGAKKGKKRKSWLQEEKKACKLRFSPALLLPLPKSISHVQSRFSAAGVQTDLKKEERGRRGKG